MNHNTFNFSARLNLKQKAQQGFTIIELVLVIVLMGILAVTVAPKMFSSDGFEEYTYQAEVIAVLRSVQLRAMQQTVDPNIACNTVVITEKLLTVGSTCAVNNSELTVLKVAVNTNHNIKLSPSMSFSFDSMGKPSSSCNTPCKITISDNESVGVIIETEGFIHAL